MPARPDPLAHTSVKVTPPLRWRVLVDGPRPGPANMARDHTLATLARPGTGTLRLYRWSPATLSLGRNEPVTAGYRELLRRHPEMGVVRRPTGGRAVVHDRELTYSVVLPVGACGGLRAAYRRINEALVVGLCHLGAGADQAAGRALPPESGPCFMEAAEGEVVVGGRKLVGSAQARIGGSILQHGSVLLVADQSALVAAGGEEGDGRNRNGPRVASREEPGPTTLAEVLGGVPRWSRLVAAFRAGFEDVFGGSWGLGAMSEGEVARAGLLEAKYESREWTWRR